VLSNPTVLSNGNLLVVYLQWICMLKTNTNLTQMGGGKIFPKREVGESARKHGVLSYFSVRPLLSLGFGFGSP